jgi:glycosyltransferase involved in cell wall biosynthesis
MKPLRVLFPWGAWQAFAAVRCVSIIREHRPDAIFTTGPPHVIHLLGRRIRRWSGLPWVVDFRDPWVAGDPSLTPQRASEREIKAEALVMRVASVIVSNTPRCGEFLEHAYPEHAAKMTSITNGCDPESFVPNPNPPLSGPVIEILHTGTIYKNRPLIPFLEALGSFDVPVQAGKKLRVRFIGDLMDESQKKSAEERGHADPNLSISLEGHMPHAESIRAVAQADVLLLLDTPGRRAGVPAKLYEYVGGRRPILALAERDSDVAWVLRESGLPHRVAPPLDREAIKRALTELLQDPATVRCGEGNMSGQRRFTRRHVAGELAAVLDSCVACPAPRVGVDVREKSASNSYQCTGESNRNEF